MTMVVFAGATVGPKRVQPDLMKLTAVVSWEEPADVLNLAAFLGLTSWFQDLIMGYVMVKKLLRDLLHGVERGLYTPPPIPIGIHRIPRTVLGFRLEFTRIFFW